MLELNLDFLFLLKGLLAILWPWIAAVRNFSKHSATVGWLPICSPFACMHGCTCACGHAAILVAFFFLDFTQAIAWILLAIAGAAGFMPVSRPGKSNGGRWRRFAFVPLLSHKWLFCITVFLWPPDFFLGPFRHRLSGLSAAA
jgi:hypothetical protein